MRGYDNLDNVRFIVICKCTTFSEGEQASEGEDEEELPEDLTVKRGSACEAGKQGE